MAVSQCASRSIFHHQERLILATEAEVEQRHNMGMAQTNGASFIKKRFEVLRAVELDLEEFDGGLGVIMHMLGQVDGTKGPFAQQAQQTILAHLLAEAILRGCHLESSS